MHRQMRQISSLMSRNLRRNVKRSINITANIGRIEDFHYLTGCSWISDNFMQTPSTHTKADNNNNNAIHLSHEHIQTNDHDVNTSNDYYQLLSHSKSETNIAFRKLTVSDVQSAIDSTIAPAFYNSDCNYQYLYPDDTNRKKAVWSRFQDLIPHFASESCKTVDSFVLENASQCHTTDTNNNNIIGHVLLYHPDPMQTSPDHEQTSTKFVKQLWKMNKLWDTLTAAVKCTYLSAAMNYEYRKINRIVGNYWEISGVSINPSIQSKGYGTMIMKQVHDVIRTKNNENNELCDETLASPPVILFTSTPEALKFYQRLGYKVFMETSVNGCITSYSCIYHENEFVLGEWVDVLQRNVKYYHCINKWHFISKYLKWSNSDDDEHENENENDQDVLLQSLYNYQAGLMMD